MKSFRVIPLLFLLFVLHGVVTTAALATEEAPAETDAPATTLDPDAPPDLNAPPVVVNPEVEEPEEQPWTATYMAPGMAVLGIVIFAIVVVYYFTRIRGRYEVVS